MAGLKPNTLKNLAESGVKLYSCVDNDEAGIKFTQSNGLTPCRRILEENGVKDYNDLLKSLTAKTQQQTQTAPRKNSHSHRWFLKKITWKRVSGICPELVEKSCLFTVKFRGRAEKENSFLRTPSIYPPITVLKILGTHHFAGLKKESKIGENLKSWN